MDRFEQARQDAYDRAMQLDDADEIAKEISLAKECISIHRGVLEDSAFLPKNDVDHRYEEIANWQRIINVLVRKV